MMLKFWILVVSLLAANFCHEVQSQRQSSEEIESEEVLEDHRARIERLESQVFGSKTTATVTMKILNSLNSSWPSAEYQVSVPVATSVFQMMVAATKEFPGDFTFRATYFPEYAGHFIDSINGLAGDTADQTFWRFENGRGVAFDRGVDLILVHANNDVIVFRFTTWGTPTTD
ncbi:uncharacterized protein [Branchiostoma lanceolatum]|uniref:uncharacterized protein n=1 Tax=Branchiostoma lanceolatum TaxID=7740 RepID=UPI0034538D08